MHGIRTLLLQHRPLAWIGDQDRAVYMTGMKACIEPPTEQEEEFCYLSNILRLVPAKCICHGMGPGSTVVSPEVQYSSGLHIPRLPPPHFPNPPVASRACSGCQAGRQ